MRVGPGNHAGELMRRYWEPALLSEEVAENECPPVRVRLVGEDLVAFRNSNGRTPWQEAFAGEPVAKC